MTHRTPIRAAVLTTPGAHMGIQTLRIDDPLPGEVRVRAHAAGLCHSDLHYLNGTLPIELPVVLGHEVTGEIVAVGEPRLEHRIGERVVATITPSCGLCSKCVAGLSTLCERTAETRQRSRPKLLDASGEGVNLLGSIGGFAEQFIIPAAAAVPVSETIPAVEACLLGCCVATGFGAVVHGARVTPLDAVAVIGCGGVGIAAIQAAKVSGARAIIAIDVHQEKLERARTFGATHTVLSSERLIDQVHAIVPGGVDASFEAVGSPATAAQAFEILGSGGTAIILGLERPDSRISIDASLLIEGDRKIRGAYMGANQLPRDIRAFTAHRASGALQLDRMVSSRWSFEQINDGFEAMRSPDAIRAVIEW